MTTTEQGPEQTFVVVTYTAPGRAATTTTVNITRGIAQGLSEEVSAKRILSCYLPWTSDGDIEILNLGHVFTKRF